MGAFRGKGVPFLGALGTWKFPWKGWSFWSGFGLFRWFCPWFSWIWGYPLETNLLGQWLNFKLFGITYLVGKIKFKLFFQGPLAEWANIAGWNITFVLIRIHTSSIRVHFPASYVSLSRSVGWFFTFYRFYHGKSPWKTHHLGTYFWFFFQASLAANPRFRVVRKEGIYW